MSIKNRISVRILLRTLCFVAALFFFHSTVSAQLPPPISPWLSMFNNNRGPLGNYHTYVMPQQQAQQQAQQQQAQIRTQGTQQQMLQGEVDQVLNQPKTAGSKSRAVAGYGQYSHYYKAGVAARPVPQFTNPGQRRR